MKSTSENRQLSEISSLDRRTVSRFHKMLPEERRQVLQLVADQLNQATVRRAIAAVAAVNSKR